MKKHKFDIEHERYLTREMKRLDEQWKKVFETTKHFLDHDQEFIDREAEKGGRQEWEKRT